MNEIEKFSGQPTHGILDFAADIRIQLDARGEPLFCLKDLCEVLGVGNSRDVSAILDADEKDDVDLIDAIGRRQKATFVTEPGLFSVLNSSRSPKAKPIRRWVNHVVLPSIRKTGSYSVAPLPAASPVDYDDEDAVLAELIKQASAHLKKERIKQPPGGYSGAQ